MYTLVYAFLILFGGWALAFVIPRSFPAKVAQGTLTAGQAARTAKFAKAGGIVLMVIGVLDLVLGLVVRFR